MREGNSYVVSFLRVTGVGEAVSGAPAEPPDTARDGESI